MAKATKTQAREVYDGFHGTLRCLNGGTSSENKNNAPRCFERLQEHAEAAQAVIANPGKLLLADEWLWSAVQELPSKARDFGKRYGLTEADQHVQAYYDHHEALAEDEAGRLSIAAELRFYEEGYDDPEVSSLASGFGFYSDDEFNDYCDEQERDAVAQERVQ